MPRAKALKVKVDDRPGILGEIASALGAKGINVRGVHGWGEGGKGMLCLVVDKLAPASKLLVARGLRPEEEEILELDLINKPGTLGDVAKTLGDAGVNIRYVFVGAGGGRRTTVFLAVSDMTAALKALK
jgi:hypothetical protein